MTNGASVLEYVFAICNSIVIGVSLYIWFKLNQHNGVHIRAGSQSFPSLWTSATFPQALLSVVNCEPILSMCACVCHLHLVDGLHADRQTEHAF